LCVAQHRTAAEMVAGGRVLADALQSGVVLRSPASARSYELRRQLGEGAHGQVWLAEEATDGSQLAIKIVLPEAHTGPAADMLAAEISRAQAASEFVRELVPRFHEAFSTEVPRASTGNKVIVLAIVMEYIDGYSLDKVVYHQPLPEAHVSIILRKLCLALQRLHERGVIHRDVKGANVMVSSAGRVYLCDFGVSKSLQKDTDQTKTVAGTPAWMAPEVVKSAQVPGKGGYGMEVDVWSVGITAIELIEGCPPLARRNGIAGPWQVLRELSRAAAPQLGPMYSPKIRRFVAQCLVKDPGQRATLHQLLQEPCGFLGPFPSSQQMLQHLVEHTRLCEASSEQPASLPMPVQQPPSPDPCAMMTLTFGELQQSLAEQLEAEPVEVRASGLGVLTDCSSSEDSTIATASSQPCGEGRLGNARQEEDDDMPPVECTLAPLLRRPLSKSAAIQPSGARLSSIQGLGSSGAAVVSYETYV